MSNQPGSILDSIKQPEYTGENRCVPCTIVNVVIAVVVSALIAVITPGLGAGFLLIALVLIYTRGYLVPGTPELTKRYLPERIHRRFDHHPAAEETVEVEEEDEREVRSSVLERERYFREHRIDPEAYLLEHGVIEEHDELDDILLTADFLERLDDHMDRLDITEVDLAAIGALFDETAENVEDQGRDYPAYQVGIKIHKWPSETALLSDLAGEQAMVAIADDWLDVPLKQRVSIRETFRFLRRDCAACGGEIVFTDDLVESCCGTWEVVAVRCADCGEHFVEVDPTMVGESPLQSGMIPD